MKLADLLHPIEVSTFFDTIWEKKSLHIPRNDPSFYQDLLRLRDLDTILAHGRDVGSDRTVKGTGAARPTTAPAGALPALYASYVKGGTVNLNYLNERWHPIARLCSQLTGELNHPVGANAYLTPPGAQGFSAHFDSHDVIVLQIHGSKQWTLYPLTKVELPMPGSPPPFPQESLVRPGQELVLNAGDLLYIPRGLVHEARTSDSASLHVSVGVHIIRWFQLLSGAMSQLAQSDPRLRQALPPGFFNRPELHPEMQQQLQALCSDLSSRLDISSALEFQANSWIGHSGPPADGHFAELEKADTLTPDSRVVKRSGMLCTVFHHGNGIVIRFPGGEMAGPLNTEASMRFIAESTAPFLIREMPGPYSDNSKLILARRLVREGLLRGV